MSTLDPAGPAAKSIAHLWWVMLAGAVALYALVMILFALVMMRPGWRGLVSPARWVVLGGLCLPAVILTPLVANALMTGDQLLPGRAANPMRIEAQAQQWKWTFRYPAMGGVETVGVLHLPAGQPVDIVVTSRDVIHAFWIPRLAGKIDAVPGHTTVLRVQADAPGRYQGLCNQFCGMGHSAMHFDVIVHPAAKFSTWLANANEAAGAPQ